MTEHPDQQPDQPEALPDAQQWLPPEQRVEPPQHPQAAPPHPAQAQASPPAYPAPEAPQQYADPAQQYAAQQNAAPQYDAQQVPAQQVPQQQYPQYLGQQMPGQQQYAYAAPGQPPQKRKGLPVGAWIGIIGGGVLLLALVLVAAFMILPRLLGIGFAVDPSAPTGLPEQQTPDTTPEGSGTAGSSGTVTLDDQLDYSAGPFWSVPLNSDWDVDTFDVGGYNRFSDPTTGCKILTFQGEGDPAETSNSDRVATRNLIEVALTIGLPWEATSNPTVEESGSENLLMDFGDEVELAKYVATYPAADGDRERQILLRAFTPGNAALYAEVDCPTAEIDRVAGEMFDKMGLTEF